MLALHLPNISAPAAALASDSFAVEAELRAMLAQARLPLTNLVFSRRAALHRSGEEAIVTLQCPVGHALTFSARDLSEGLTNPFFNDRTLVPHLCKHCAYPGQVRVRPRKATIYHRLSLLREKYPRAVHVGGFDIHEEAPEHYNCGEKFADGTSHPPFAVSYHKLQKAGPATHHCYVCALRDGLLLEVPEVTVELVAARMHLIADLIDERCIATRKRRRIVPTSVQSAERSAEPLTYSTTSLVFSCHQPEHPSVVATANQYFKATKGGYCKLCLQEAGMATTKEVLAPPVPVGGRRRPKAIAALKTPLTHST